MDEPTKRPVGRPTLYSLEITHEICVRLVRGESLNRMCKDEHMPHLDTVYTWLFKHSEFAERYAQARQDQADTLADEMLYIADTPQIGKVTITKADGKTEIREGDMTQHRTLQIETRKWIAARLKPTKYGSKVELGGAGGGPILISSSDADL